MKRWRAGVSVLAGLGLMLALPMATASATSGGAGTAQHHRNLFPTEIALPTGFLPEGIAIGSLPFAYFGSRADGDIFRVNLVTGAGRVISQGPGTPSVGMKLDQRGRL